MQAKQKFIIMLVVLGSIFLIGLGIIFYFYYNQQDSIQPSNKNTNTTVKQNINKTTTANTNQTAIEANANTNQTESDQDGEKYVVSTAKNFAVRFGTFSNQSNYENLENLLSYMSEDMKSWAENYIANNKNQANNEPYSSITTTATGTSLLEYDDANGFAKVQVETIRVEKRQIPASENKYQQKIAISFIKENGAWKVGAAEWL
jgi:flagellar basal body-associated protein FliL